MRIHHCVTCGATAGSAITTPASDGFITRYYCERCHPIARASAGAVMSEGPIVWGADWREVEDWLVRSLALLSEPLNENRRLIAHDLRNQLWHLPADRPATVAAFLASVDANDH